MVHYFHIIIMVFIDLMTVYRQRTRLVYFHLLIKTCIHQYIKAIYMYQSQYSYCTHCYISDNASINLHICRYSIYIRQLVRSSPGRVKPKPIQLLYVASPRSMQLYGERHQDNVSQWSDISIFRLLLQWAIHRHLFHSKNICPLLFLTSR